MYKCFCENVSSYYNTHNKGVYNIIVLYNIFVVIVFNGKIVLVLYKYFGQILFDLFYIIRYFFKLVNI